jgi:hypothetical protein
MYNDYGSIAARRQRRARGVSGRGTKGGHGASNDACGKSGLCPPYSARTSFPLFAGEQHAILRDWAVRSKALRTFSADTGQPVGLVTANAASAP